MHGVFFKSRSVCLLLLVFVFHPFLSFGRIELPSFFADNMVLQQQTEAAIWGTASAGSNVQIVTSWNRKKYTVKADATGKWKTKIATPAAGGPYQITISDGSPLILKNVLIGEVWLCTGQSNMEMPLKGFKDQAIFGSNDAIFNSANDHIRLYTVPRSVQLQPQDTSKPASWKIAAPETIADFSAVAYYYARLLHQTLHVPIGLVNISYGGSSAEAWMSESAITAFGGFTLPKASDGAKVNNKSPTTLYNGMLHPFIGYTIKGCLWYQGESNYERPEQYERLFPAMVKQWREEFNQGEFPFYFAQIAPYGYNSGGKYNSAYLRDAQRKAVSKIGNSGIVVLMDAGEENTIHPGNKEVVGKRFAYLALAKTYGLKGFGYTSPAFDSLKINGSIATIKFTDANNGLTTYGKPLSYFEIAGADKSWKPAKAVIVRGTVQVSSPDVKDPVAVRYAFKDFVNGDLFSTEGFPVSSFRTDDW